MIRAGLVALVLALAAAAPARAETTITMSGSSVAQALVADLAYFYGRANPGVARFELTGGGTGIGMIDVSRGIVDAGLVSRNLGPGDPPGLVLSPFALSGVCLVTNPANPVPGITRALVQDLVSGRATNWSQIPGSTRTDAIVGVALDVTGGSRQVFESVFVDVGTRITYAPRTFATSAPVREFIASTPAAWGYLDLAFATRLHSMTYEGVPCARETIRTGAYPAQRPLGIVTRGRPRGAIARFVHWVATSRKAKQVIATRYLPYAN